ncbi:hypothetical protein [Cytophaga aurantiaca]|uniref:hypothetical protein n=1 Tax=Cytophaga aurantiaca TaxID=29530 RepID=UPI000367CD87|nr:hypothetical protein [Cytophaga aurantiaca]
MKSFLKKYLNFIYSNNDSAQKTDSSTSSSGSKDQTEDHNNVPEETQKAFVFQSAVQEEEGYEAFARYLSLRIISKADLESFPEEAFYVRETLEDTKTILVLDYPSSIEHVLKANAAAWDKTEDELFERALKNIQETYHRVVVPYEGHPQAGMWTLTGDDAFKTSAVLYLEEYPALQGTHGALVALPDKDTFICKIIEDDISLEVGMQFLVHFTDETYHNSESRISRQIYWYINGEFTVIPYSIGLERMNYVLPFDLEDRLF